MARKKKSETKLIQRVHTQAQGAQMYYVYLKNQPTK